MGRWRDAATEHRPGDGMARGGMIGLAAGGLAFVALAGLAAWRAGGFSSPPAPVVLAQPGSEPAPRSSPVRLRLPAPVDPADRLPLADAPATQATADIPASLTTLTVGSPADPQIPTVALTPSPQDTPSVGLALIPAGPVPRPAQTVPQIAIPNASSASVIPAGVVVRPEAATAEGPTALVPPAPASTPLTVAVAILPPAGLPPHVQAVAPVNVGPGTSQGPAPAAVTADASSTAIADGLSRIAQGELAKVAKDPSSMTEGEKARRFVMSLCRDQQGRLWVGCEDTGVWCFDASLPKDKQWRQYTTKDGLGDDNGYAVACDRLGRVWAGHLNHGVSVFNGNAAGHWQNYEVVGGLSRPDTLSGPLGERVFHIAVNPKDGDVWIATNCGLSRYSESKDTWRYYTRAEGLPSEQASSLAFDRDGNVYVATQCDGVAMADAQDEYMTWRTVTGPDEEPTVPAGEGLPSNLTNDVLVASDGAVYVATDAGLAWSKDHGKAWRFVRGKDWADKVRGRDGGPPPGWQEALGATLGEDYCTRIVEGGAGRLWVGHRDQACEMLDPHTLVTSFTGDAGYCVSLIAPGPSWDGAMAYYGIGVQWAGAASRAALLNIVDEAKIQRSEIPLPASAPTLSVTTLQETIQSAKPFTVDKAAAYAGQDWCTQGDWLGRYGRQHSVLCAAMSPFDQKVAAEPGYDVSSVMGPHAVGGDKLRGWIHWATTGDGRSLYDPIAGCRRQAEWDDHGEGYRSSWQGPDILVWVQVPRGVHRASLYFFNKDAHYGQNSRRDYVVTVRRSPDCPALARGRVRDFSGGVYQQFLITGPGKFLFVVERNHSVNSICSAVLIDRLTDSLTDAGPLPWMGGVRYGPWGSATASAAKRTDSSIPVNAFNSGDTSAALLSDEQLSAAVALWSAAGTDGDQRLQVMAYRAAIDAAAPEALLAAWRWKLRLWTPADRAAFAAAMDLGWAEQVEASPKIDTGMHRPMTPHANRPGHQRAAKTFKGETLKGRMP